MRNMEREAKILALLARQTQLSVGDLAVELAVSEATVRRDLHTLEERGQLRRIHGGATLEGLARAEPVFEDKQYLHPAAKQAIARAALCLIKDGDRIYLDGGSTVLALARLLDSRRDLTIVTNSLMAAAELMKTAHRLILVGGEFRMLSRTLVGPLTAPMIQSLRVDKAFMGTIGFSLADGMTTTEPSEAFTKEQVMKRAGQVILLADSSKFGRPSFARSGRVEDVNVLICDGLAAELEVALTDRGVQVIVAGSREDFVADRQENSIH